MIYATNLTPVQVAQLLEDARESQNSGTPSSDEEGNAFPANASPVGVEGYSGPSMVPKLRKDEVVDVYHAALFLRQVVLAVQTPPRPAFAADLVSTTPDVPDLLYNFLAWLMYGDTSSASISAQRCQNLPADVHRRVMSIAQDIIFLATRGHVKQAKHICLSMAVCHLTGSKKVITLLNRFGHEVSAPQLEELETGLAQQHLEDKALRQDAGFLPLNVHSGPFLTLCSDNSDRCEETLSGKGTTHCTNGITIHRQICGPFKQQHLQQRRNLHRSIAPRLSDVLPYNAGGRQGPPKMNVCSSLFSTAQEEHQLYLREDFT